MGEGQPVDDRSRTHVTKDLTHSGPFPLSAVTSARLPRVTTPPRIIYGQGQDTRAHSSWPSPGSPGATNKVTGAGLTPSLSACRPLGHEEPFSGWFWQGLPDPGVIMSSS